MYLKQFKTENLLTRYWVEIAGHPNIPEGNYGIEIDTRHKKIIIPRGNIKIIYSDGLPVHEYLKKEFLKPPVLALIKCLK